MRAGLAADFGAVGFASSSSSEELDAELLELRSSLKQAGRWVKGGVEGRGERFLAAASQCGSMWHVRCRLYLRLQFVISNLLAATRFVNDWENNLVLVDLANKQFVFYFII